MDICSTCNGHKKINNDYCPACQGVGRIITDAESTKDETLLNNSVIVVEPQNWNELIEKLGVKGDFITLDLAKTTTINPLCFDYSGNISLTISDLIDERGNTKSYEEVIQKIDVPYAEWESAVHSLNKLKSNIR